MFMFVFSLKVNNCKLTRSVFDDKVRMMNFLFLSCIYTAEIVNVRMLKM